MAFIASLLQSFSFAEALTVLTPLLLSSIAMVIYAIFVFKFYRFIAKKDIFELNLNKYNHASNPGLAKFLRTVFYFIEYIILFPIFSFFWFLMLAIFLAFLTTNQATEQILLISMALVVSVRITAYYREELSNDLAKLLPFGLLAVFLANISGLQLITSFFLVAKMPALWTTIVYYLLFAIVLELTLRIIYGIVSFFIKSHHESKKRDYLF